MKKNKNIIIVSSGIRDYQSVNQWQSKAWSSLMLSDGPQYLWLGQHPSVITCGRRTQKKNILSSDAVLKEKKTDIVSIDRGGDVTWHGPGQLVVYPLVNLNNFRCDLNWYLRQIESVVIDVLKHYGIEAFTIEDKRAGVWVKVNGVDCKIASIGIHTSRWISKHGFALNLNPDMSYFNLINPCGLNCQMIAMEEILKDKTPTIDQLSDQISQQFISTFECQASYEEAHVTHR